MTLEQIEREEVRAAVLQPGGAGPGSERWPIQVGAGVLLLTSFLWAYATTLQEIVAAWGSNPDYTHGYLVVPLALYFLWLRREDYPNVSLRPSWIGLALIATALVCRAASARFFVKPIEGWSILVWVAGAVALLGGWPLMRFSAPSIAFLFFMVPLPYRMSHWLSGPLQRAATLISCWVLQALGQPALAEGNTILLGEHHLEVEEACSGLRIFMGILAIAFAYVIATRRRWWEQLLILASAFPVALIANSARIVVTGLLYQHVSGEAGKQFSHDVSGWIMIPFAAALFAIVVWYLGRLLPEFETLDLEDLMVRRRV